eukprot:749563-Hanusia_phi.AAC.1
MIPSRPLLLRFLSFSASLRVLSLFSPTASGRRLLRGCDGDLRRNGGGRERGEEMKGGERREDGRGENRLLEGREQIIGGERREERGKAGEERKESKERNMTGVTRCWQEITLNLSNDNWVSRMVRE